ncbi:MAG: WbqC family protein [Holosporales bacterium]|jgi:hypothetical protein|nr:WbqC family protein [Holosporales bacterium]
MKTIAIHQPNFLPWRGYFQKIHQADVFVFLDDVQISLRHNAITHRTRSLRNGTPQWLTMPVIRAEKILDVQIGDRARLCKLERKVREWYCKAPYFKTIFPILERVFAHETDSLAEFNINAITLLCHHLNIHTPLMRSSTLNISSTKQERILDIVTALGGDRYLSGKGAIDYQSEDAFKDRNITLEYISYNLAPYPQFNSNTFVPGLSVIDLLMNCGLPPPHL